MIDKIEMKENIVDKSNKLPIVENDILQELGEKSKKHEYKMKKLKEEEELEEKNRKKREVEEEKENDKKKSLLDKFMFFLEIFVRSLFAPRKKDKSHKNSAIAHMSKQQVRQKNLSLVNNTIQFSKEGFSKEDRLLNTIKDMSINSKGVISTNNISNNQNKDDKKQITR